jgi:predicted nuclease of predicted toxin-antitoxin system
LRFLVDESVSADVTDYLRSVGQDVLSIAEVERGAVDENILARAVTERRILITNDKDFGEIVFRSGQAHHGVLLLRLRNESAANQVQTIAALMRQFPDYITGQFAVVKEDSLRIHGGMVFLLTENQETG